jgi:hypothetical protein
MRLRVRVHVRANVSHLFILGGVRAGACLLTGAEEVIMDNIS